MDSKFQSDLQQCNRLMESANANFQQKNFGSAINDYTKIIMFVPNWIENAEKNGVSVEFRGIFIAALQSAYARRAASYLSIGDKEKHDADFAMSRRVGVDVPVSDISRQNNPSYSSAMTPEKNFVSAGNVTEYQAAATQAIVSENYEEGIDYCDKILEMEPRNCRRCSVKQLPSDFWRHREIRVTL